jgi:hypothetical protein
LGIGDVGNTSTRESYHTGYSVCFAQTKLVVGHMKMNLDKDVWPWENIETPYWQSDDDGKSWRELNVHGMVGGDAKSVHLASKDHGTLRIDSFINGHWKPSANVPRGYKELEGRPKTGPDNPNF